MASITSATSGLASATSTWTGGVVPVVGDKVTISHPGTNDLYSTLYQLNGAAAAGTTSIPVDTGSGTIVAGECIKVLHQTGTEDGCPTYDPTYYKVTTGITGAGTLVITPGLSYAVADNTQIINCGHVVEIDGTYHWGDDTSSGTLASNAIIVRGALKFSRSVNSQLTCRGSLVRYRAPVDMGCRGDRIPAGVTATLIINESATLATGKHIFGVAASDDAQLLIRGAVKTRNTTLLSPVSAGATSITVAASSGWSVGDRIALASPDTDATKSEVVTISGGSAPTWAVSAVTYARVAGSAVGNLSSNVTIKSYDGTKPGSVVFYPPDTAYASYMLDVGDCRIENCGGGYWAGVSYSVLYACNFAYRAALLTLNQFCLSRIAIEQTAVSAFQVTGLNPSSSTIEVFSISDYAIRLLPTGNSSRAVYCDGGVSLNTSGNIYSAVTAFDCPSASPRATGLIHGHTTAVDLRDGSAVSLDAADCRANNYALFTTGVLSSLNLNSCVLSATAWLYSTVGTGINLSILADNCTFLGGLLTYTQTQFNKPSKEISALLVRNNGSADDIRLRTYWQETIADTATRNRGSSAVKVKPNVANESTPYRFTIPATAGTSQTIKGFLRFDTTYGTATPPVITLSGQGVSQTFAAPATANAWHAFSFTFTPTTTGNITATVTVQSTSTSGYAWLDGVYHDPMIRSTRHYGYLFKPQASLDVDSRVLLSESAALALPVSVNHGSTTITISGPVSASELGQACHADICQSGNQGQPVHFDWDASQFTTSYALAFSGSGALTAGIATGSNGSTGLLTLTGAAGANLAVLDDVGAVVATTTGITSPYSYVPPFGSTGTWSYKLRRYGYLEASGSFTATGATAAIEVLLTDAGVVASEATAAAYTGLAPNAGTKTLTVSANRTTQETGDYLAWWIVQPAQALVADVFSLSGGVLNLGDWNIVVDGADLTGNLVTTGNASQVSGGRFLGVVQAGNGASGVLTVSGLTGASAAAQVYVEDDTGVQQDFQASVTGSYQFPTPFGSSGVWRLVVNKPGYYPQTLQFNPQISNAYTVTLLQITNPDGAPLYTGTASPNVNVVFDTATTCTIEIGGVNVSITEIINATQDAYSTAPGMAWLANDNEETLAVILDVGQTLTEKPRTRLWGAVAGAGVSGYVVSQDGIVEDPAAPYPVRYASPPASSGTKEEIADAVRTELAAELQRVIELSKLHGLDPAAPLVVQPSARTAGTIQQTITTVGDVVTVTRTA